MAEFEQVTPEDDEIIEEWVRNADDPDVLGAGAWLGEDRIWRVNLNAAEFVREDPLETEMRGRMHDALGVVPGVTGVEEEDREQWICAGSAGGEALVRAAAGVADAIAPSVRAMLEG